MKEEVEKEETETDREQKDVADSNKRLNGGGMGKLQLGDVSVKVCQLDW